jgi:hypothetical protein
MAIPTIVSPATTKTSVEIAYRSSIIGTATDYSVPAIKSTLENIAADNEIER